MAHTLSESVSDENNDGSEHTSGMFTTPPSAGEVHSEGVTQVGSRETVVALGGAGDGEVDDAHQATGNIASTAGGEDVALVEDEPLPFEQLYRDSSEHMENASPSEGVGGTSVDKGSLHQNNADAQLGTYTGLLYTEAAKRAFQAGYSPRFVNALTGNEYRDVPPPHGTRIVRAVLTSTLITFYCSEPKTSAEPFRPYLTKNSTSDLIEEEQRRAHKRRIRIIITIASAVVGAVLVAMLSIFVFTKIQESSRVAVPNVTGVTVQEAASLLSANNLTLGNTQSITSADVPEGTVVSQAPAPGAETKKNEPVNLVVSSGPKEVKVPNLVGLDRMSAETTLKALNLEPGSVTEKDDPATAGTVVEQAPLTDTEVREGTVVNLIVSNGKTATPSVIGKTLEEASTELAKAGFKINTVRVTQDGPAGLVVGQTPPAGTYLAKGDTVELTYTTPPVSLPTTPAAPADTPTAPADTPAP